MPSAISRSELVDLPSWRNTKQSLKKALAGSRRYNSTEQNSRTLEDGPVPLSTLHKGNLNVKGGKVTRTPNEAANACSPDAPSLLAFSAQNMQSSAHSPWQRNKQVKQVSQGIKRKYNRDLEPLRAQKQRSAIVELKDKAYILRTMKLPTKDEYPYLPSDLMESPKNNIHHALQTVAKLKISFTLSSRRHWECIVSCLLSNNKTVIGKGEGTCKTAAEQAAYLYLLAKLHEDGILPELFGNVNEELDKQTLHDEADAKLDIYNYAARFDCIPNISVNCIKQNLRARKLIEVTVTLPEQKISISGRGVDIRFAEIAAGIRFKKEAEKYHAQHGSSSIVIKDSTALNTSNSRKFFDFYKIVNPGVNVETQVDEHKLFGHIMFRAQVMINSEPVGEPVIMNSKKKIEDLAYLTAAIAIKKIDSRAYPQFLQALRAGHGEILGPMAPISMSVDEDCMLVMRETLLAARKAGLPDEEEEVPSEEIVLETRRLRTRHKLKPQEIEIRSANLQHAYQGYLKSPELIELRRKREELPMNAYRAQVLDIVNRNDYSIIVGATGSGKTTQVPQILLDEAIKENRGALCNIICTQPRRIAATSVARRVADERAETLQNSIGYHVRFDARLPQKGGNVTYCTTGILLLQLQHSPDEVLDGISHLIIDEVHERDMLVDFLLIILKKTIAQRAAIGRLTPKVVLMSATIDTELFASYFKSDVTGKGGSNCPTLSVPGRTFPVKEQYLEDILETFAKNYKPSQLQPMRSDVTTGEYLEVEKKFDKENLVKYGEHKAKQPDENDIDDFVIDWKQERKLSESGELMVSDERETALVPYSLVAMTVAHIVRASQDGAILVFLPGLDEILKVNEALFQGCILDVNFQDESKFKLLMLHSSIPAGQREVFEPVPQGCRKIILATNIAETSITIPDVQYVVDSGKLREKQYDQIRRITKLQCTWISKSNSKQRAGRAGRVQNGHYYALFSKARYDCMKAIGPPEMLRADLQETCLSIKAQAFKSPIREFLAEAIEPPAPKAVDASVKNLEALDALTDDENITPLGRLLASLPVHPALGKMIVLGVIFRCLDPMLILGAAAKERSIFITPLEQRRKVNDARTSFTQGSGSDHVALLNAVREMRYLRDNHGPSAMNEFGRQNFIHFGAFRAIDATAKQIEEILVEAGLCLHTPAHARRNSEFGDPLLNQNSDKFPVIKALALAGLHPNLAVSMGGRSFRTLNEKRAMVHPSSVNAPRDREEETTKYRSLLTYSTMTRSNDGKSIFLRDTSELSPLMVTLFGGRLKMRDSSRNVLEIDGWLPFYIKSGDRRATKTILEFRKALERLFIGAFRDLSSRRFLATDKVREVFAEGLVDVL